MRFFNCGEDIQTITPHREGTTATDGVAAAVNVTHFDIERADRVTASILEVCWLLDGSNISEELFRKRFGEKGNKPFDPPLGRMRPNSERDADSSVRLQSSKRRLRN